MGTALKVFGFAVLAAVFLAVSMAAVLKQELGSAGLALRGSPGSSRFGDDLDPHQGEVAKAGRPARPPVPDVRADDGPPAAADGPRPADLPSGGPAIMPAGHVEPVAADAPGPGSQDDPARAGILVRDLAVARSQLADARTELAGEKRRHAEAEQAADATGQARLATQAARSAGLERELASVRSALAGAQARTEDLVRERDERQQRVDADAEALRAAQQAARAAQEQAQRDAARQDRERIEAAQQIATLQAQLAAETQNAARLEQDRAAARIDLAGAEARVDDLVRQAAEARLAAEAEQAKATMADRDDPGARPEPTGGTATRPPPPSEGASGGLAAPANRAEPPPRPALQRDAALGGTSPGSTRVKATGPQGSTAPSPRGSPRADVAPKPLSAPQPGPAATRQAAGPSQPADAAPSRDPAILVVLRYAPRSDKAHARAMALRTMLQGKGVTVSDPVGSPKAGSVNRLSFFYDEDKPEADRLAAMLAMPRATQGRLPAEEPLPRPGTIEITVGG